jgi:hypothetical protein
MLIWWEILIFHIQLKLIALSHSTFDADSMPSKESVILWWGEFMSTFCSHQADRCRCSNQCELLVWQSKFPHEIYLQRRLVIEDIPNSLPLLFSWESILQRKEEIGNKISYHPRDSISGTLQAILRTLVRYHLNPQEIVHPPFFLAGSAGLLSSVLWLAVWVSDSFALYSDSRRSDSLFK